MSAFLSDPTNNEEARLNALRDLRLLDTPPSESFDRLTRLASRLLGAPVSTISLTDRDRQWFKSRVGVDLTEIPREQAPCSYAIEGSSVFVVTDMLEDDRFRDSPLAQAGIRFYAGAPLFTRTGHGLGTLCVVDAAPREIGEDERSVLLDLAGMVMSQIDLQNMIGRVDATSGFPNQHQMFEDLEEMARRSPGGAIDGILLNLAPHDNARQALRVIGPDFIEAVIGDALRLVHRRLPNAARFYHVGPTHCVAILPPESLIRAPALVERLLAALAGPVVSEGVPVTLAPALGTYGFPAGEARPRDVLRRLFSAVEDAREGAGDVAAYSIEHDQRHARSFRLLNDFQAALEAPDQLSLAFQPRVCLRTGACLGVEALLRWQHPLLGNVSPGEFIPAVEQTALARPMTDWVIAAATRQIAAWRRAGLALRVSINASARNLDEPDFAGRLIAAARASEIPPEWLEIEFTESTMGRDSVNALEQMRCLRDFGVDIAIDDFGTGYSNLAYLQSLPACVLKIDRTFVGNLENSLRDQKLVRTITTMAHDLGYRVVAEGIETEAARDLLRGLSVDEGQGFLLARPMPARDMPGWLAAHAVVAA